MKLDSCGSALSLCYLQHLWDTTVMADKKTGGQSVKKTVVVSFASNTKRNISQLSHGLAAPREWLNFAQGRPRGAGCKGEASAQQHITPIRTIQSLGHLIFPDALLFCIEQKTYAISSTPGNKCKNLPIIIQCTSYPQLICWGWKRSLWKICRLYKQPTDHAVCHVLAIIIRGSMPRLCTEKQVQGHKLKIQAAGV